MCTLKTVKVVYPRLKLINSPRVKLIILFLNLLTYRS